MVNTCAAGIVLRVHYGSMKCDVYIGGKKLTVTKYVQNVRRWLKHKLASVQAIGQLYYQPSCTTQLRDVRGLPLPVRRSSKPVSCIFLDKFFIPLRFQFLSKNS